MKIKSKLNFGILGATVLMFLVCTITTYIYTKQWAEGTTYELVKNKSLASSILVKSYFEDAINKVTSLRDLITILKKNKNSRRNDYRDLVKQTLENNENYLSVWTQYEANTMDNLDELYKDSIEYGDKGRFQHAYFKSNGTIQLQMQPKEKDEDSTYLQDYYLVPKNADALTIIEPYMYDYIGDKNEEFFETSITIPDHDAKNNVIGVIGIDLDLTPLQEIYKNIKLYENGFCQLLSNEGIVVTSHFKENIKLKTIDSSDVEVIEAIKSGKSLIKTVKDKNTNEEYIVNYTPIFFGKYSKPWSLSFRVPRAEVFAEANKLSWIIICIEVICLFILGVIVYVLASKISNPLLKGISVANEISGGNLSNDILQEPGKDEIALLINSLGEMSHKLRTVILKFSEGTNNITHTGVELNEISRKLADGATSQYQGALETASSIEQISASIKVTSENAKNTENIYKKVVLDLNRGYAAVDHTLEQMRQINDKVRILNELSSQTNILALNAAVEAARAGVHGKGFSVIASEVRKLAEKSTAGANEITELTQASLMIASDARNLLFELLPDIERTVKLINEIATANAEQEQGINQINLITSSNHQLIRESTTMSEEMSKSASELLKQSELLREQLSFFQIDK